MEPNDWEKWLFAEHLITYDSWDVSRRTAMSKAQALLGAFKYIHLQRQTHKTFEITRQLLSIKFVCFVENVIGADKNILWLNLVLLYNKQIWVNE